MRAWSSTARRGQLTFDPTASALQSDGKLLVAGEVGSAAFGGLNAYSGESAFIARFNADGSVDASFGEDGLVLDRSLPTPTAILQQSNGELRRRGTVGDFAL